MNQEYLVEPPLEAEQLDACDGACGRHQCDRKCYEDMPECRCVDEWNDGALLRRGA
jgi:hypothetical protein